MSLFSYRGTGEDWVRGWTALGDAAFAQASLQTGSEPVQRFIDLFNAAVASGKAHIAAPTGDKPPGAKGWGWRQHGTNWEARGDRVGWVEGKNLYLELEAAFAVVQRLAQEGGEPLAVGSRTLHRRLHEKKALLSIDEKRSRLVIRKTLDGRLRAVLHMATKLFGRTELAETTANGGNNGQ